MFGQQGVSALVKDGTKHMKGLEAAVLRNTEAAKKLAHITRTSLGPKGLNKMVINSRGKLFVTSDAATILKELDVIHPAAKILVMASELQESTCGDGTNTTVSFGGELLVRAEELLNIGLHPSEIVVGYSKAYVEVEKVMEELVASEVKDLRNMDEIDPYIRTVINTKSMGNAEHLPKLIGQACIDVLSENDKFSVDNVRTCKVLGGNAHDSFLIKGFALNRGVEGTIKRASGKVAVYATGIDYTKTETKANVILRSGEELEAFSKGEEGRIEETIKGIADAGVKIAVSGGAVGELALHFLEKYNIMVVKVSSKFDLRRLAAATGATPLVRLGVPIEEELGVCDQVQVEEIGSTHMVIFRQDKERSQVSTLILRGSSHNTLSELELAVNDGVSAYRNLVRDPRLLFGGGAFEVELSRRLRAMGEKCAGLEQYAIKKYAEALLVLPRSLAENCGKNTNQILSKLKAAHEEGKASACVDTVKNDVGDAQELHIFDSFFTKASAIRLATEAAVDILRVDQIIMAKRAGGPKPPKMGARDAS